MKHTNWDELLNEMAEADDPSAAVCIECKRVVFLEKEGECPECKKGKLILNYSFNKVTRPLH